MLNLNRLAWLKAGAPPRNVAEAAFRARFAGGGVIEKTLGPADLIVAKKALAEPLVAHTVSVPVVQSGSGDPSPDNVRPISGWTGTNVCHAGKNLFDVSSLSWNSGIRNDNGTTTSSTSSHYTNAIPIPLGATITVSGTLKTSSSTYRVYFLEADGTWISRTGSAAAVPKDFTPPDNCGAIQLQVSTNASVDMTDVQIELGSDASAYEAYAGGVYTFDWSGDAGTVYGGTLDVITGKLTVDRAKLTLDSTIPSGTSGIRSITSLADGIRFEYYPYRAIGKGSSSPIISSAFANRSSGTGMPFSVDAGSGTGARMYVCLPAEYNTDALIRGYFNDHPTDFVYYLATAQTYQLTATQITMLLGTNNLWADCGQTTITYKSKK